MKQRTFLIILALAIFSFWPQNKMPAQSQAPATAAPATPEAAALNVKEKKLEKKLTDGKEAILDEITRIKNLPPKVVTKNNVKTVYKDVPNYVYIDTCIGKMRADTFLNLTVYDTTHSSAAPVKKLNFFQKIFGKIFHRNNQ